MGQVFPQNHSCEECNLGSWDTKLRVVIASHAFASYPQALSAQSLQPSALSTTILVRRFWQSGDEDKAVDFVDPFSCQVKI